MITFVSTTEADTRAFYINIGPGDVGRRNALNRAIGEGRINKAGQYIVAQPSASLLHAEIFTVDEVLPTRPRFVIREG